MNKQRINFEIDSKLHKEFKMVVLSNDTNMKEELIKMIEEYVKRNKK